MIVKVHTSKGDVTMHPPVTGARAVQVSERHVVRSRWEPVPSCRLDRLVGEVWYRGMSRFSYMNETCHVACEANGRAVYRDRASGIVLLDSPAVQDELLGRLTPDPRSSQGGLTA